MADIVSQGKIFANVPGAGGGLKELTKIKNFDIKGDASTEVVTAIGTTGGAGFRRKQGGFSIDMTSYREAGQEPEIDWIAVDDDQRVFTMTTEDELDGRRMSYKCRISSIDSKQDSDGNYEDSIKLACIKRYRA